MKSRSSKAKWPIVGALCAMAFLALAPVGLEAGALSHAGDSRPQEAVGVAADESGTLALSAVGGRRVGSGFWTWRARRPGPRFDTVRARLKAEAPPGSRIELLVRAVDTASGADTGWRPVQPDVPLDFGTTSDVLQLQLRLHGGAAGSPRVRDVEVLCSIAGSRERAAPVASSSRYAAGHNEPPGYEGPVVDMPRPEILRRESWGSADPAEPPEPLRPKKIVVHHSCLPRASRWLGAATVRGIQRYHMAVRGWNDIGYHYLIGPDGTIHEGRPEGTSGAHARPNHDKLGICVVGDFNVGEEEVSTEARGSLVRLLAYLTGKYGIAPRAVYGHRDFNPTDCPGTGLYASLPGLREEVDSALAEVTEGTPRLRSPRARRGGAEATPGPDPGLSRPRRGVGPNGSGGGARVARQ